MPKERKESQREFVLRMTTMYPKILRGDKSVLFCLFCNCVVSGQKLFQIKQHFNSKKHMVAQEKKQQNSEQSTSQSLIAQFQNISGPKLSVFNMDLCKMFLEVNIPLHKVNHPSTERFITKYTTHTTPDESTLRRNYVPFLYEKLIDKLRAKADGKHIWISLDETTDVEQRMVANFIFGILGDASERGKSYLLNVMELEKVNANTIATFVTESLLFLWPKGIQYDKVMIAVTDAASYMLSAFKSLQVLFPKMIHITCFAHGLHRLAEFVRCQFPEVNKLISNVKAIFIKCPARRQLFKNMHPEIPLPPQPIITRWGTWLSACAYYAEYIDIVKSVVDVLDENDAESIEISKKLLVSANIRQQISFIIANFMCIVKGIKILETKGLEKIKIT